MPNIHKLTLTQKSGLLTELQSDTIFGHFCWRLKDMLGDDKLKEFLELYKNRKPVFTISNSFFERDGILFLQNPLLPIVKEEKEKKTKDERIEKFLDYKDSKKRKFLTLEQFNFALNGKVKEMDESIGKDNSKQPQYIEDLRTSVEISRKTFSSEEGQLFSYAPYYIDEEPIDKKKNEHTKTNTIVFVKVLDEDAFSKNKFDCENILKEVFNIGFGKKKSSGYGQFEVEGDLEEYKGFQEPEDSNGFITLSNYLPSTEDGITAENSYYDLNIKYGKLGEELALSSNPFKKPIVFMTPGSCFKIEKKDFYGRCVSDIVQLSGLKDKVIQNGIAFSLRMKIMRS